MAGLLLAACSCSFAPRRAAPSFARAASVWRGSGVHARTPPSSEAASQLLLSSAGPDEWARVVDALRPFARASRVQKLDETLSRRRGGVHLVLENVGDPFNVAAVLRTAEGLGVQHVHLVESVVAAQIPAAESARARRGALGNVAMGAARWLSLRRYSSSKACFEELRRLRLHVIASDCPSEEEEEEGELRVGEREHEQAAGDRGDEAAGAAAAAAGSHPLDELELPRGRGVAVIFGSERRGVSRAALENSDARFYLPM